MIAIQIVDTHNSILFVRRTVSLGAALTVGAEMADIPETRGYTVRVVRDGTIVRAWPVRIP